MDDTNSPTRSDLQRSYGSNWTKTNVSTLFEWISVAAYNIQCLELGSAYYRKIIRRHTILGLVLSTLSGTISVSTFGISNNVTAIQILNGIFAFFSFSIAVYTGYIKIYQIQETLEHYIKMKQEWTVFSTSIASELQLPIELRRDALFMIIKNKNIYLKLLTVGLNFPENVKKEADQILPHPFNLQLDVTTLPRIIMDIGSQELNDLQSAGSRNKDRFTRKQPTTNIPTLSSIPEQSLNTVEENVNSIVLEVHP